MTRRSKGEGSIFQRKDGRWVAQATVGVDRQTGKPKRRTIYGKTRPEVARKLTKILHEVQTGNYVEPSVITVKRWFEDWLDGRKPHIEEKTYIGHELMIRRHIVPAFGAMKLKDVRTRDVQTLLNEKLASGLSVRTVKYIHTTLNMGFKQAIRERLITFNPADSDAVELPKDRETERVMPTREEMAGFLITAKRNSSHYAAFVLELATGLRRGELLALRRTSIDFKKKVLIVKEQLVRSSKGLEFKDYLKTKKSRRVIKLAENILAVLEAHLKERDRWKAELKLRVGSEEAFKEIYRENDLLFCTDEGKPLDPDNFARHFKSLLKKAGLKNIRFHDLRHIFATWALEDGLPVKTVQDIMGHTTSKMLMDIYAHTTADMQEEAAQRIGGVMAGVMAGATTEGTKK
ncbi:MAG: site-specific integrase [Desulfotomaculaceae bacterium]